MKVALNCMLFDDQVNSPFTPQFLFRLRRYINHSRQCFISYPNILDPWRVVFSSFLSAFGYPDETLSRVSGYSTVAETQDSFQSMTKHISTGIQELNNFLFKPAGLRAWKAYNVCTSKFSLAQPKKYGTPQGPSGIKELQPPS